MKQPKPDSKKYEELIYEIGNGTIKIPKFQREFVWKINETAKLLDSILKGYPVGTFILWETDERMNNIRNIGDLDLSDTPEGTKVQYVLDGQQRITSLYAAYKGAKITKPNEKKETNYQDIFVSLNQDLSESDDQIITAERTEGKQISLHEVLNFNYSKGKELETREFTQEEVEKIDRYHKAFKTYEFSTIVLKKEDIDSAIEVFTRINTSGQTLTLFEIMSAKTYDEEQNFDMQTKWDELIERLDTCGYEGISSSVILFLLSLILAEAETKECKRKTTLKLDKQKIIDNWDSIISALEESIDYFRRAYLIPVSRLLPFDVLLVPFAYFFYYNKDQPSPDQKKFLEEYFWCASLSFRYSSAVESSLAQDIKRIDKILKGEYPEYKEIKAKIQLNSPQSLIDTSFSTGSSYCKAILCLLASKEPKDFKDNSKVLLDNSYLKVASSKNYHHFFPKKCLENISDNSNSLVNITLVSDRLNKKEIGAKPPSEYIRKFENENENLNEALNSHFISRDNFGIDNDNYETFLKARAKRICEELKSKINLDRP